MQIWRLLTGPEDIGQTPAFWLTFAAFIGFLAWFPTVMTEFQASSMSYFMLNIPLALGLSLLWGYCGILSFGQVAFVGIAGYTYGIIAGNLLGNPWGPAIGMVGALVSCAVTAAIFGYFMFYARVQMWIVPILTLVFTLLLETFLGQTAGYQWRVGDVHLGGYNGMTGIPPFQIGELIFWGYSFYYYVLIVVLLCFLGCRMLVSSRQGQVMLAIREDAVRTEVLGYDIRARQLAVFVLASVLAGITGLLYVQWGNYITPAQVGLLQAALPVVWVAVGGRDSLLAVAISTYALTWLTFNLSSAGFQSGLLIIGFLLVIVMMFFPKGIIVTLARELPRRGWRAAFSER